MSSLNREVDYIEQKVSSGINRSERYIYPPTIVRRMMLILSYIEKMFSWWGCKKYILLDSVAFQCTFQIGVVNKVYRITFLWISLRKNVRKMYFMFVNISKCDYLCNHGVYFREFSLLVCFYQYSTRIPFYKIKTWIQCSKWAPNFVYNCIRCIIRLEVVCVFIALFSLSVKSQIFHTLQLDTFPKYRAGNFRHFKHDLIYFNKHHL